jgi:hypothetical protein
VLSVVAAARTVRSGQPRLPAADNRGRAMVASDHHQSWDHVRELPVDTRVDAIPGATPSTSTVTVGGEVYQQVPETGFTMLIAWHACPAHLVRLLDLADHLVTVTTVHDGGTSHHRQPRGQTDQDAVDEDIEEYLTDAGIPAPPRGYRWYQRAPRDHATLGDLYSHINSRLLELDPHNRSIRPRDIAAMLDRVTADLDL